ncbi:MAG: hypothetical protein AAGD06_24430 [Acidobacteriota bacterium]
MKKLVPSLPLRWLGVPALVLLAAALAFGATAQIDPAGRPGPGPAQDQVLDFGSKAATHGVRVAFRQLNWLDASGSVLIKDSKVGEAEVFFSDASAALFTGRGGYVNITTSVDGGATYQWSVQNLYHQYKSKALMLGSSPSVQFDLTTPNGTRVPKLLYRLSVTGAPLSSDPGSPNARARVPLTDYLTGGRGGGSGTSTLPYTIGPWVGPSFYPGRGVDAAPAEPQRTASTSQSGDDLPKVDEDIDGCAPGAVARSIKYMADNAGVDLPDVQDIYKELYEKMGTTSPGGTSDDDIVAGKAKFAECHGLDLDTELIYLLEAVVIETKDRVSWHGRELPVSRVTQVTTTAGGGIDLGGIQDALDAGKDVEVLISWNGGGGHIGMVTSITCYDNGQYEITYVDDPNQGNGQAENEEHTETVNPDGSFGGGQIDGFLVECLNAGDGGGVTV